MDKRKLVYLASPYTPLAGESVEDRVTAACQASAKLMMMGLAVFAPIPHSHAMAAHLPSEKLYDHDFWMEQDLAVLEHCEAVYVLKLPGWEKSRGVAREIELAKRLNLPIIYMEYYG